jgi:hypothetical protein
MLESSYTVTEYQPIKRVSILTAGSHQLTNRYFILKIKGINVQFMSGHGILLKKQVCLYPLMTLKRIGSGALVEKYSALSLIQMEKSMKEINVDIL